MSREEILSILLTDNPDALRQTVEIYADSFRDYQEAATNIGEHGNIVAHPRTGAPIDNPYVKIKAKAIGVLNKIGRRLKTARLWELTGTANNPPPT